MTAGRRNLLDFTLDSKCSPRQSRVAGLCEKQVQPARVIDGANCRRRDPETEGPPQCVACHCYLVQIGQEPALGLVVRMADVVAGLGLLARKFTLTSHR